MGLLAQERRGARGADWTPQRVAYGLSLALLRNDAEHPFGRTKHRDGQGEGVLRHRVEIGEMAFAHLLLAANGVELHQLNCVEIVELSYRRIVKRQMTIFADAQQA